MDGSVRRSASSTVGASGWSLRASASNRSSIPGIRGWKMSVKTKVAGSTPGTWPVITATIPSGTSAFETEV